MHSLLRSFSSTNPYTPLHLTLYLNHSLPAITMIFQYCCCRYYRKLEFLKLWYGNVTENYPEFEGWIIQNQHSCLSLELVFSHICQLIAIGCLHQITYNKHGQPISKWNHFQCMKFSNLSWSYTKNTFTNIVEPHGLIYLFKVLIEDGTGSHTKYFTMTNSASPVIYFQPSKMCILYLKWKPTVILQLIKADLLLLSWWSETMQHRLNLVLIKAQHLFKPKDI